MLYELQDSSFIESVLNLCDVDLYEFLYAGTDGPYPSACDIRCLNFEISTQLCYIFSKF